jgi:hypothetical protein
MGTDRRRDLKATSAETDNPTTKEPDRCNIAQKPSCPHALERGGDRGAEKIVDVGEALSERRHAEVTETTSLRGGAVCLPDAFIPWNLSGHGVDISAWPAFFLKFLVLLVKIVSCSSKKSCPLPAPSAKGERLHSLTGIWPNQVFPTVCTMCVARGEFAPLFVHILFTFPKRVP